MKKFGLIGHPISHSQSPVLFKQRFPDPQLIYDLIETPDFEEAFRRFKAGYDGINVTAPFKENAFRAADRCSAECRMTGAANVLVLDPARKTVTAHNTDVTGVIEPLENALIRKFGKDWKLRPLKAMVIGIGGAGKAAALALLEMGMCTYICNRSQDKPEALLQRLKQFDIAPPVNISMDELPAALAACDVVVYCLPLPLNILGDLDFSDKIVLEANYKDPSFTEGLIKKTTLYISGREWLKSQAVETWRLFGLL